LSLAAATLAGDGSAASRDNNPHKIIAAQKNRLFRIHPSSTVGLSVRQYAPRRDPLQLPADAAKGELQPL